MKSKIKMILALKQFAKEIVSPEAMTTDITREETSEEGKKFLNSGEKTLKALEERTLWTNRVELCIGIFKEVVRKYTREADSPLEF